MSPLQGANLYNPVMHSSICAWGFHEPHSPWHPMAFGEWKVLVASWKVFTNSSSWFSGLFSEGTDRPASTIGWGIRPPYSISHHLHPAAGTRTRHPLLSKASFPVPLEIEQQSGLWLPMIPTSLLCTSAASCPTPVAKVSSVVQLVSPPGFLQHVPMHPAVSSSCQASLNPTLMDAAFDLVPPGWSSSSGSRVLLTTLHPDAIIDGMDRGGFSVWVWEGHELASDLPDDAPLVIADSSCTDGSPRW